MILKKIVNSAASSEIIL